MGGMLVESARADVLIETIRADARGEMALWDCHLARLTRSASELGFPMPPPDLREQVAAHALAGQDTRIRVLFARDARMDITHAPLGTLTLPARARLASDILGASAVLASQEPLLRHKATHRPWYTAASAWLACHEDCFDLLFTNERGELCEGSRTNLYVLQDGVWLTPPTDAGCLPGTQRERLLASGAVRAATLTLADLGQAQGTRLSNALRGWFDTVIERPALQ